MSSHYHDVSVAERCTHFLASSHISAFDAVCRGKAGKMVSFEIFILIRKKRPPVSASGTKLVRKPSTHALRHVLVPQVLPLIPPHHLPAALPLPLHAPRTHGGPGRGAVGGLKLLAHLLVPGRVSQRCRDRRPEALTAHTQHTGRATTKARNAPPSHCSLEMRNPCVTSSSTAQKDPTRALASTSLHTMVCAHILEKKSWSLQFCSSHASSSSHISASA